MGKDTPERHGKPNRGATQKCVMERKNTGIRVQITFRKPLVDSVFNSRPLKMVSLCQMKIAFTSRCLSI